MPPLPVGLSAGEVGHEAPGGATPPPRSSVASRKRRDVEYSASWSKSMSSVEGNAGVADCSVELRPWWNTVPTCCTPVSDGAPAASHLGTERSSVPAPLPSTQSVTFAPLLNAGSSVELSRTRQL